jgi:hypothetical protein
MNNLGGRFEFTASAGDYLAGDIHEHWIGDQNGDGILEWLVFYFYVPWMTDGIDNDGDTCVDERNWGFGCDALPDAMVIYETGQVPTIGGDDGTLLVSHDFYTYGKIKIFRIGASIKWRAHEFREQIYFPQIAGEFVSYLSYEAFHGVNANPEMDNDMNDYFLGILDARGFPTRPPVNHVCVAGYKVPQGSVYERDDGWIVVSHELVERFDGHDWNGDGDQFDYVAAYHVVDPDTGHCRLGVNTGVYGISPMNKGSIIASRYAHESSDGRDWNRDGDMFDYFTIWHNIDARDDLIRSWWLVGRVYTSLTYTAPVRPWGWGFNGLVRDTYTSWINSLKFGTVHVKDEGGSIYRTYFTLASDEDGNRHTKLPSYYAGFGLITDILGGVCIQHVASEHSMANAGLYLANGVRGDANGDGDRQDEAGGIFCPDETGGGGVAIVEPTSKFAKGLYLDPIPWIWNVWTSFFHVAKEIEGRVTIPINRYELSLGEDCNNDGVIEFTSCNSYYQIDIP